MAKLSLAFSHFSVPVDESSGVTTWICKLLPFLAKEGYSVSILLHRLFGEHETNLAKFLRNCGVSVCERNRPYFIEDATESVLEFLRTRSPNIFLPNCLSEGYYAAMLAGKVGLPWIFTIHSDDSEYWEWLKASHPWDTSGGLVGVSQHICNEAQARHPQANAHLIHYGVERGMVYSAKADDAFRVIYCGRVVEKQKRISLVLQAMELACGMNEKVTCHILGTGAEWDASKMKIDRGPFSTRIHFCGHTHLEEIRGEMASAHAILFMSDYEGLPLALLEAMSVGVVPVVRKIPSGIPEVISDGFSGFLVDDKPETAARAICQLAENPEEWCRYSLAARDVVEKNFTQDISNANWAHLIGSLIKQGAGTTKIRVPRKSNLPKLLLGFSDNEKRRPSFSARISKKMLRIFSNSGSN